MKTPPPLPAKPPQSSATPSPTPSRTDIEKLKGIYNFDSFFFNFSLVILLCVRNNNKYHEKFPSYDKTVFHTSA